MLPSSTRASEATVQRGGDAAPNQENKGTYEPNRKFPQAANK